jgi:hypothetical protein
MSPSESCMLSRAYEWPLQATFAESSLARRVPLLRPSPCRPTPIATTALPFVLRLEADGAMTVRYSAQAGMCHGKLAPPWR